MEEAELIYVACSGLDGSKVKDPYSHDVSRVSALFHLGQIYFESDRTVKALQAYNKALEIMPSQYQPQVGTFMCSLITFSERLLVIELKKFH